VSWFSKRIFTTSDDLRSGPGYRIEDTPGGTALIATGLWTSEAADVLRQGAVDALILGYTAGFNEGNLEFLESWPLRRLRILDRSLMDLGPLARVGSSVEELYVEAHPRATLDLAPFSRLRSVAGQWSLLRDTVDEVESLRSLSTWHFSEETMLAFSGHGDLEKLTLNQAPCLETLLGVGGLDSLSVLTVFPARELADLSDLADLAPSLRELKLEGCKEIDRLDVLADLVNLDYLDIADCARVESVAPLAGMQELTAFYAWGGTRIVDADLSPLLELPKLRDFRMRDRKEYRPSVTEIHANISSRA
jgi:internalin A